MELTYELRQKAEEQLSISCSETSVMSREEVDRLVHELQVHQIELKLQNEELCRTQLELELSRDRYLDLYDFAPVGYLTLDPASVILEANLTAANLLSIERKELIGKKLSRFIHISDQDKLYFHNQCVFSNPGRHNQEFRLKTHDDTPLHVSLESITVDADGQKQNTCRIAMVDITDRLLEIKKREQLEDQIRHTQKMETVGLLAVGIAHDINNFLTAIKCYAVVAKASLTPEHQAAESLNQIGIISDEMAEIIRGLSAYGQRLPNNIEPVQLGEILARTVDLTEKLLPASIEVLTKVEDDQPVWVQGNPVQLQQVIVNLILNAQDAMPNGGTITVSISSCSAKERVYGKAPSASNECESIAQISVSDTGVGIPKKIKDRIFDPFFTTKTRAKGAGLGLSIVHGIVKSHGGQIKTCSESGQGTTFTIELPIYQNPSIAVNSKQTPAVPKGNGELILLAEDNKHVNSIMSTSIEKMGYKLISVEDGISLRDRFEQHSEHIVLLLVDVDLPKSSGLEAVEIIRSKGFNTPVIYITGKPTVELENYLDEYTFILPKPFSLRDVEILIAGSLENETSNKA